MEQSWLSWFLKGVLLVGLVILLGRLFELTILKGDYFKILAQENRIRRIPIVAARGEILARGGESLAFNKKNAKWVVFNPDKGFEKKEVTPQTPADEIIEEWTRRYPLKEAIAHITGYLGEANEDEVGKVDPDCRAKGVKSLGSLAGRGGLEEEYECVLRGIDGEEMVEVDAFGKKIRTIGRKNPLAGENIKTNIDYLLQMKLAEAMDKPGAAIVSDARGEILAFYSSPSFDPNIFINQDRKEIAALLTDKNLPLFNRVLGGTYHPGSVFKVVTATAALEEGKISPDYTYEDPGVIKINEFSYANWYFSQYGATEGVIDLKRAITRSTDTFFYEIGELVGVDKLAAWAQKFGLNEKTGIDLPGEVEGLVPTPAWKKRVKGEAWFLGNTYHMAIGQGDLALTPLSVNSAVGVIASGGSLCTPHLVNGEKDDWCKKLDIGKETIAEIKEGMVGVCSQGGTAFPFFDFEEKSGGVKVACKTGTAETEEEDKTHAWFTAFAPADDPQIIATVLVEKGGEGSSVAAPIVRELFNYYFGLPDEPRSN